MATIHQDRGTDPQETGQQRSFPTTTVLQILAFLAAMLAMLLFAFWTFVAFLAGLGGGEGSTPGQPEIELLLSLIATLGTLTAAILIVGRLLRVSIALSAACWAAGFILWLLEPPYNHPPEADLLVFFVGPSLVALGLCVWLLRRPDWPTPR